MTRLARRFAHASAVAVGLAMAGALAGFVRISFQPTSPGFFWGVNTVPVVIQEDGAQDVPGPSDEAALRLGMREWEDLTESRIAFVDDPLGDPSRTDFDSTDIHLILWDEDGSSGLFPPGSSIVALTPLRASLSTGQIVDADIVFNGAHAFSTTLAPGTFDVQSVATHELGHLIGFDHGGGPFATMHSTIVAGTTTARSLSRDEVAAATHVYPAAGAPNGRITGTVFAQGGPGLRYAQVVAIDDATGEVASGDVTDAAGNYAVEGLPAGTYSLYVEPLDGPFVAADTIALQGQTPDTFATTWNPGGSIALAAGGQATATWSVNPVAALAITQAGVDRLVAGSSTVAILRGANLATVALSRVTGTGVSAAHVVVGGELRVTLTAQPGAARGVRSLEVSDALGRVAVLTAGVDVHDPDPQLTGVSPTSLAPAGGQQLAIDGDGFLPGSAVVVAGQLATNVVVQDPQRIVCDTPPSPGTTSPEDVVVIRPDGREARGVGVVSYLADPRPTSVDPDVAATSGGTRHFVRGTGFAQGAVVEVDGASAVVLSIAPTEIEVLLPPHAAGPVDLVVRIGAEEGFLANAVTYVDGTPPVITSFSPTSGPAAGGTQVTIRGLDLPASAQVTFGGAAAGAVSVSPAGDELTCVTPPHAAGAADVRVRDPATGLTGIASNEFTYTGLPPLVDGGGGGGGGGCALATGPARPGPFAALALLALVLGLARRRPPAA